MNRYPIPEIEEMTKKTRRIGLGVMGFADMLVRMGIPYDSDEALDTTGAISIIAGASSGIETLFALAYERNVMDNTRLTEVNPALEAVAKAEGFHSGEFARQVAAAGSLQYTDTPQ